MKKYFFGVFIFIFVGNLYAQISFNWKATVWSKWASIFYRDEVAEVKAEAGVRLFESTEDTKETSFYVDHTQTVHVTYGKGGSYSEYQVSNWGEGYIDGDVEYKTLTPGWYKIKVWVYRDWWRCWFDRKLYRKL